MLTDFPLPKVDPTGSVPSPACRHGTGQMQSVLNDFPWKGGLKSTDPPPSAPCDLPIRDSSRVCGFGPWAAIAESQQAMVVSGSGVGRWGVGLWEGPRASGGQTHFFWCDKVSARPLSRVPNGHLPRWLSSVISYLFFIQEY